MPALLEGIIRPLVKELLQDIIASTRDALPPIVEKVIREEIEKLKKL
jgi:cell pole-organizing protein PopZ